MITVFRDPVEKELKMIRFALRAHGSEDFTEKYRLIVVERGGVREVYALSPELYELTKRGEDIFRKMSIISIGLKIGEVGKRFRFTLEGAFFIAKKKKKRVYVNSKGEMLFLYGRDVFSGSVMKATEDIRENDLVFVCNTHGDILGLGRSRYDGDRLRSVEEDRVAVENLVDRGEYLRKEKIYRSF
jgi:60S ribosome subunit biogenesis protein NIP7